MQGFELAQRLREQVTAQPNVDASFRPQQSLVAMKVDCSECDAGQAAGSLVANDNESIVATGSHEYPAVFQKNDLPGVMLGSGVRKLMHLYGVKPGKRGQSSFLMTESGLSLACELLDAGIQVAAVVDSRFHLPEENDSVKQLRSTGVDILSSYVIQEAHGSNQVDGAVVVPLDAQRRPFPQASRFLPCDLICLATDRAPAGALVAQSGGELGYNEALGKMIPQQLPPHVFCAGDVTGIQSYTRDSFSRTLSRITGRSESAKFRHNDSHFSNPDSPTGTQYSRARVPEPVPTLPATQPRLAKEKAICVCMRRCDPQRSRPRCRRRL